METLKAMPFQVSKKIVDLVVADNERQARYKAESEAAHKELWATVHAEYPELDVEADFTLNCEYAEQGVVMLDVHEGCSNPGHAIARALSGMIKDIN